MTTSTREFSSVVQKAPLAEAEEQVYSQRKSVRYDIRDLTFELIASKYDDSIDDSCENGSTKKFNVIYVPEYQRDFTWDMKRQSKFIESLILGLPIPFIFVAENKDSSWEIVDGSQRIRTIHAFLNNSLILNGLESLTKLNGYYYNDLDRARKGKILNTAIRLIVLAEETTEDIKKDMFERINRGSDLLKPMETRKGVYKGAFNSFIYEYCRTSTLLKKLAPLDKWLISRQEHEELVLRFFALSENNAFMHGIDDGLAKFLDQYIDRKNKELELLSAEKQYLELEKYKNKIDKMLRVVDTHFPFGFRLTHNPQTKRSVFEAISVGVWLTIEKNTPISSKLTHNIIKEKLNSNMFKQFTHIANQLHKKPKLQGRIEYIFNLLAKGQ